MSDNKIEEICGYISNINFINPTKFDLFMDYLDKLDFSKMEETSKTKIYRSLKNRLKYSKYGRKYNESRVERIQKVIKKISLDIVGEFIEKVRNFWDKGQRIHNRVLQKNVIDFIISNGTDVIIERVQKASIPLYKIGYCLPYPALGSDDIKNLLDRCEKIKPAHLIMEGFIENVVNIKDSSILNKIYNPDWNDSYKMLVLRGINGSKSFWDWLEKKNLSSLYWKNIYWENISFVPAGKEEYKIAFQKLDEYENYSAMLELVFKNRENAGSSDIVKTLLKNTNGLELEDRGIKYWVKVLLVVLYRRKDVDNKTMFQIEIKNFGVFGSPSKSKPRTIIRCLCAEPKFFVGLISQQNKEVDLKNQYLDWFNEALSKEQGKAYITIELLLKKLERTFLFAGANEEDAKAWLKNVIPLLEKSNCKDAGYETIGEMLANAPDDPEDSIWPVKYVREFIEGLSNKSLEMFKSGFAGSKYESMSNADSLDISKVDKFRNDAEKIRSQYPKTACVLDRTAYVLDSQISRINSRINKILESLYKKS